MSQALVFVGALVVLLAVVPLAGFVATGSWRQAMRYTRDWARVMAFTVAVAGALALVFMSTP